MEGPRNPRLREFLDREGSITYDQLDKLLKAGGYQGHADVVRDVLDPQSTGSIDLGSFRRWLYPPNSADSCTRELPNLQPSSPRAIWRSQDVSKINDMLQIRSNAEEALVEYQSMAQGLVNELHSRHVNMQAEAFIEQVCGEKILEGCLFVGHVKTDLDSVAGAIGAATLWKGQATRAERVLNGEIKHALDFAGLPEPPYFDDVPGAASPDSSGKLLGVCLVDHNEEKQMVETLRKDPLRNKRIHGVIDHHCLSENFSSDRPLFMDIRPWGSMSSIVANAYIRSSNELPKPIARILLCAILSDTLNLQSITTTVADRMMVALLSMIGEVKNVDELAKAMFRAKTEWIVNLGAYEMTRGDQKDFACCGWKVGIAVLEVTDPVPVLDVADRLILELRILKIEKGTDSKGQHDRRREMDFMYLFVVDVTNHCSTLLICGGRELALAKATFPGCALRAAKPGLHAPGDIIAADQTMMVVGAKVSRKAEFVPAFFQALSQGFTCHKLPMSDISEEIAMQEPMDEVYKAMQKMDQTCYHDSVNVVRDYKGLTSALERRSSLPKA